MKTKDNATQQKTTETKDARPSSSDANYLLIESSEQEEEKNSSW